ncbi:MAG: PEP-CTERM sorting domain-containing protein [Planctomycetota bacterium]
MQRTPIFGLGLAALLIATGPAQAAMFDSTIDPTTAFSTLFIDDANVNGGGDSSTTTAIGPQRNLDIPTGMGPLNISFEGIGLNFRGGTSTSEETLTITIEYLGADGALGGGDDLVLGTETATLAFTSTNIYTAIFDNPITALIDGVEDRFRFTVTSTGNMRFKQWGAMDSPSGQNGIKVSAGGTVTVVPEPSTLLLLGMMTSLGSAAMMRKRLG